MNIDGNISLSLLSKIKALEYRHTLTKNWPRLSNIFLIYS